MTQARRQLAIELNLEEMEELRVTGSLAAMDLESVEGNNAANREILNLGRLDLALTSGMDEVLSVAMEGRSDLKQLEHDGKAPDGGDEGGTGRVLPEDLPLRELLHQRPAERVPGFLRGREFPGHLQVGGDLRLPSHLHRASAGTPASTRSGPF